MALPFLKRARNVVRAIRGYDGASPLAAQKRLAGMRFGNTVTETAAAAGPLAVRARYLVENNDYAKRAVETKVTALVGTGAVPVSMHPDPDAAAEITAEINRVSDSFFDGGFGAFQALMVQEMVTAGEAVAQIIQTGDTFRLFPLSADQIDRNYTASHGNGVEVLSGVEMTDGEETAIYVLPMIVGSLWPTYGGERVRVPAGEYVRIFKRRGAGQVRGVSDLASSITRLAEIDKTEDAYNVNITVSAMHCFYFTDENNVGGLPYTGTQTGGTLDAAPEPGVAKILPAGLKLQQTATQQVQQVVEYLKMQLRAVAAGIGVPYHLMAGDSSDQNYSSTRAELVGFKSQIERDQFNLLVPGLLTPIYERAIRTAALSGRLSVPGLDTDPDSALAVEWYFPPMPWVDPAKDAAAQAELVANGFKSRRQVVAELGYDVAKIDAEIAADKEREKTLGLSFPLTIQSVPAAGGAS